jgi:hypothetical protein
VLDDSLDAKLLAVAEAADACGLDDLARRARSARKRNKRKEAPK